MSYHFYCKKFFFPIKNKNPGPKFQQSPNLNYRPFLILELKPNNINNLLYKLI
jgi:hypothetical protein